MLPLYLIALAIQASGYLLPNPPGRYNVTLANGPLTDYSRHLNHTSTPTPRALMLSVFQPAECASTVAAPYMPNKTAAFQGLFFENSTGIPANLITNLVSEARLPVCDDSPRRNCTSVTDSPILLLLSGYQGSRLLYNVIASAIASEGFTVITIDHPEETNIITYPNGDTVYGPDSSSEIGDLEHFFTPYVRTRAADASFVIDQLSNATAMGELLPRRGARPFSTEQVGMLGHSLGGATSVFTAAQDPRVRSAINWDGTLFGSPYASNISQPVMLVSSPHDPDDSWATAWTQMEGPKLEMKVANVTHTGLMADLGAMLKASGQDVAPFAPLVGSIDSAQLVRILTDYTVEWMNGVFAGKVGGPLFEDEGSDRFPEVSIVRKENF